MAGKQPAAAVPTEQTAPGAAGSQGWAFVLVAACHSWRNCFSITVLEICLVGAAGRAVPCHAGMPCACLQLVGAFGAADAQGSGDLFKAGRW